MRINRLFRSILPLFFLLLTVGSISAQKNIISGTVTDKGTKEPIPGVSVIVDGTTRGTVTDFDGKFTLKVIPGETIAVSFIGYVTQKIEILEHAEAKYDIKLVTDTKGLDEVIVVGYGVVQKKDKTGAVYRVDAESLNGGTLTDPIQAMQGKAAGVTITKQGGDPNAGFNIRIRGSAGFVSNVSPLYVVNGVVGVDPTTIASEDIESYNVLKDASSTAIYGSRGANGVVLITTKKAKEGTTSISFNAYAAVDVVANQLDLLSADEYRNYASTNSINIKDGGTSTDWQDEIYRTGLTQNYNASISGGTSSSNYRGSFTHNDFEGVVDNTSKTRDIVRVDLTQKAFDNRLTMSVGLSGTIESNKYINYKGNGKNDVLFQAFQRNPTYAVYNEDGSYNQGVDGANDGLFQYYNPRDILDNIQNDREAKKMVADVGLDFEISKGLIWKNKLGYIRADHETSFFEPRYSVFNLEGYGKRAYVNNENIVFESYGTFNKMFNAAHNVGMVAGYSYQEGSYDGFHAQGREPATNSTGVDKLQVFNNLVLGDIESYRGENKLVSFFGRFTYDYKSKYYATVNYRYEGSSRFGKNNEWGHFPSVSVGWSLAEESFLKDNVSFIDVLKLRLGAGLAGNQDFKDYQAFGQAGFTGHSGGNANLGYVINANPDLKWEENQEVNVGVDFGFLNNRVSGAVEYYKKETNDLLGTYSVPTPPYSVDYIYDNAGQIDNQGVEVTLSVIPVMKKDFEWNSTLTFSTNSMEVVTLDKGKYDLDYKDVGYISAPGLVGVPSQRIMPGESLGTFFGLEYAGLDSNGGWLIRGNDNEIYRASEIDVNDDKYKKVIGSAMPDFELGWSNRVNYKNWDFSMAWRAVVGHDVLNVSRMVFGNPLLLAGGSNGIQEAVDLTGTLKDSQLYTDFYIEDGSFLRLDNVNLGYNFDLSDSSLLRKLRLYFSANNLLTITKYSGLDPEFNFDGGERDKGEIYYGVDQYNVYPKTRTFTFGLNATF